MKSPFWLMLLSLAACNQEDGAKQSDERAGARQPRAPLSLSSLELTANAAMLKRGKDLQQLERLESAVGEAMEEYLFDPYSVKFRNLRQGRGGAVCGQYNAKNRLGAYVGFRDFVLSKDGETVYASRYSDGVETELHTSFADAYLNACATKAEVNVHQAQTETYYYPTYDDAEVPMDDLPAAVDDLPAAVDEEQLVDPFEE